MYFCTVLTGFYKGTDIKTGLANLCTLTRVKYYFAIFLYFKILFRLFLVLVWTFALICYLQILGRTSIQRILLISNYSSGDI